LHTKPVLYRFLLKLLARLLADPETGGSEWIHYCYQYYYPYTLHLPPLLILLPLLCASNTPR